jgi:hypothetical protein
VCLVGCVGIASFGGVTTARLGGRLDDQFVGLERLEDLVARRLWDARRACVGGLSRLACHAGCRSLLYGVVAEEAVVVVVAAEADYGCGIERELDVCVAAVVSGVLVWYLGREEVKCLERGLSCLRRRHRGHRILHLLSCLHRPDLEHQAAIRCV